MRKNLLSPLISAIALIGALAPTASAQIPVIDPANLAQSIIQVTQAIEQINNQVRQIEQQAQMLARNPLQLSPELSAEIDSARSLFATAQDLSFEVDHIGEDLRTLYPDTWTEYNLDGVLAQSDAWLAQSRASLSRAAAAEASAARALGQSQSQINRALAASASAEGQTSAVQAGNQLLGVQAAELAQIQTLLIAQGRALTAERLERAAREERAREIQRRAFPAETNSAQTPARTAF